MSYWLTDPELFLYTNGTRSDDVQLWRCKKTSVISSTSSSSSSSSSLVVPMKPDDFDYVKHVTDYLELLAHMIVWDETDYNKLVRYIYERCLLVNNQGLVIVEMYKRDDPTMVPIYIRSLDVLALKPYIPNMFRDRPVPLRTVQVLEDVNGKAALMVKDPNVPDVTKLTAKIANLESKNKNLETNVTKLTSDKVVMTAKIAELESKNKTLEGKVATVKAELIIQKDANAYLQRQLDQVVPENPTIQEVWMNDFTNRGWVGILGLEVVNQSAQELIVQERGLFTQDDDSTNVRARWWYKMKFKNDPRIEYKAVYLETLRPNQEKARFLRDKWQFLLANYGNLYVVRRM